jgi:hypothetical protein
MMHLCQGRDPKDPNVALASKEVSMTSDVHCTHEAQNLWVVCHCVLKGAPVAFINPEVQVITCKRHMDPDAADPEKDLMALCADCARERGILPDDPETAAYEFYVNWCAANRLRPQ